MKTSMHICPGQNSIAVKYALMYLFIKRLYEDTLMEHVKTGVQNGYSSTIHV